MIIFVFYVVGGIKWYRYFVIGVVFLFIILIIGIGGKGLEGEVKVMKKWGFVFEDLLVVEMKSL